MSNWRTVEDIGDGFAREWLDDSGRDSANRISDGVSTVSLVPLVPVSMLNEFVYCPRLFHLRWVQGEWAENAYTLDGQRVHRRVDHPAEPKDGGIDDDPPKIRRSLDVGSDRLGLIAKIDVVEADGGEAIPVEYKRGHAPDHPNGAYDPERVQLCAQGLLLRDAGHTSSHGFLYFAGSRRRVRVDFDDALIAQTLEARDGALVAAAAADPPEPLQDSPKCPRCALVGICLPDEHHMLQGKGRHRGPIVATQDHGRSLHVMEPGAVIRKDGRELVITREDEELGRMRLIDVSSVAVHGRVGVTTSALRALIETGRPVAYFSFGGWYVGRSVGHDHKNVLLRIAQFRAADSPRRCLEVARSLVRNKLRNGRVLLRRHLGPNDEAVEELSKAADACSKMDSLDRLLGLEGNGARVYFGGLGRLLKKDGFPLAFERRNRRPPRDPINAMLSYAYALLTSAWTHTLSLVGLDPYLGFYHQPRYGRPALALDMMEAFRPLIADSVVLTAVKKRVVDPEDFIQTAESCALTRGARRKFIKVFEGRMEEEILHPIFGYRLSYRRAFEVQARLFGRYLTGELEEPPEFLTR